MRPGGQGSAAWMRGGRARGVGSGARPPLAVRVARATDSDGAHPTWSERRVFGVRMRDADLERSSPGHSSLPQTHSERGQRLRRGP